MSQYLAIGAGDDAQAAVGYGGVFLRSFCYAGDEFFFCSDYSDGGCVDVVVVVVYFDNVVRDVVDLFVIVLS